MGSSLWKTGGHVEGPVDERVLAEIEAKAVEFAGEAGNIVQGRFGVPMEIEYKDEMKRDPVTSVDKESQAYLYEAISRYFPDHDILGEEGSHSEEASASDFLWVLDPLDGTTNFLSGLPVYAVSIGVLHRGTPVAGALFIPWPGKDGGYVLHARKGAGAWKGVERISMLHPPVPPLSKGGNNPPVPPLSKGGNNPPVPPLSKGGNNPPVPPLSKGGNNPPVPPLSKGGNNPPVPPLSEGGNNPPLFPLSKGGLRGVTERPEANRLVGLPGSFGARFRLGRGLRRHGGEVRVTGSVAYELALTASGALQYVVLGGPRVWDVAAGVLIVMEAGGSVMVRDGKGRRWESLTILGPSWERGRPGLKEMSGWVASMIAGEPQVVTLVAANLGRRHPLKARMSAVLRKLARGT